MNSKASKISTVIASAFVVVALAGCVKAGETRSESQQIELGSANSVRMHVAMGAGELKVAGGSDKLLKADFTYNVAEWKPQVRYVVAAGNGDLEVTQPGDNVKIPFAQGDIKYQWNLAVNNNVPLDLVVDMGAGTSNLDLSNVNISSLDMNLGAGETTVDLTGHHAGSVLGEIKGGAGKTSIVLPKEVGVRVVAHKGVGNIDAEGFTRNGDTYQNAAYGKDGPKIDLTVNSGVGDIELSTVSR